jgi:signal transduction histidine kinase
MIQTGVRIAGGLVLAAGAFGVILGPFVGNSVSEHLWGLEPLVYVGLILLVIGMGAVLLSYVIPHVISVRNGNGASSNGRAPSWSQVTEQYFALFDHDLGRPLRRILGKERELRAILRTSEIEAVEPVKELLDEIEMQTPNFRLMMSNIRILIQLEEPGEPGEFNAVEPAQVLRKIVDRYTPVAMESGKDIIWWSEPEEFGMVYSDSSVIEHIVTNLVDNAMRYAVGQVQVRLTKNPTHFFVRVWDDGPGIANQYTRHIFDRGWTPAVAKREEKTSSGLGLYIARTLARRYGGDLTVESVVAPDPNQHTSFLLSLPINENRNGV